MARKPRRPLDERVIEAAQAALAAQDTVAPIDVLVGLGWLDANSARRWRQGQLPCLEEALQARPESISEALELFHAWADREGLPASEAPYVARTPGRDTLRFSQSGDPARERLYRTHRLSPALSARQRARPAEKASRAPDLVAIMPLNEDWTCHRCGGGGGLLVMEPPGPACLACVGLGALEFLPAGDARLTRRAKAESARFAVVVRFSRRRKRYERQGLLVEPEALAAARREVEEDGESGRDRPARSR